MDLNPLQHRVFGVVYGKKLHMPGRNHILYAPHGFDAVPELKNKILHNVRSQKNLDFSNGLIQGNIEKNNASWESLVNAYSTSKNNEIWGNLLQKAFSETIATSDLTVFIDEDTQDEELKELFDYVEKLSSSEIIEKEDTIIDAIESYTRGDKKSFHKAINLL